MGAFFGFIFGLWFVGAVVSSPYFWAKRVDRSLAPIARRFMALAYGLGWPYYVYNYFASKKTAGTGNRAVTMPAQTQPAANPFRGSDASVPAPTQPTTAANPFRD